MSFLDRLYVRLVRAEQRRRRVRRTIVLPAWFVRRGQR